MKYILITLLSFTFATQITTREFIVSPNSNFSTINPSDISGLSNGKIEVGGFTGQGQLYINNGSSDESCDFGTDSYGCETNSSGEFLFNENTYLEISFYCFYSDYCDIKFWITGAFEDEDSPMGDMNNDGSLNVYDVLIMVGIILDGDSGDIFDVMEIIKRV